MRNSVSSVVVWCSLVSALAACSGARAKEPDSALKVASLNTAPAADRDEKNEETKKPAEKTEGAPAAEPAPPPAEDSAIRKASRPPLELISIPNVVFIFNFKESEVGLAAKSRCDEEAPDDPREHRACLDKARGKVPVEFTRFVKDDSGQWWWVTYNKYKGNLLKYHKIQFTPGEETAESIVLKPFGKDKGIAPMAKVPRTLQIDLPNDYSIVLHDREFGKMVFDAKIGLMEPEK
jgi:hypothetical protein